MDRTAVIFGATGLVGSNLLEILLEAKEYRKVIVISRRSLGISNPKLEEILVDYDLLSSREIKFSADAAFCTLGTTQKKTPDRNQYHKIEHDYPLMAARLSKENGVRHFAYNSSIGADLKAGTFYLKTKAETELDISRVGFDQYYIYRPSLITGQRNEKRFAEDISKWIFRLVDPLLAGKFKKYRSISARKIAYSMYRNSLSVEKGQFILESDEIDR